MAGNLWSCSSFQYLKAVSFAAISGEAARRSYEIKGDATPHNQITCWHYRLSRMSYDCLMRFRFHLILGILALDLLSRLRLFDALWAYIIYYRLHFICPRLSVPSIHHFIARSDSQLSPRHASLRAPGFNADDATQLYCHSSFYWNFTGHI
jgi:hypothetical protein